MPRSNLISLARRGVLLLNTSLTVSPHKAGSHSNKGWETFTDKVVELVDKHGGGGKGVVVLAWGQWAAKRVAKMDKVRPSGWWRLGWSVPVCGEQSHADPCACPHAQKKHLILTSAVRSLPSPSPLSGSERAPLVLPN